MYTETELREALGVAAQRSAERSVESELWTVPIAAVADLNVVELSPPSLDASHAERGRPLRLAALTLAGSAAACALVLVGLAGRGPIAHSQRNPLAHSVAAAATTPTGHGAVIELNNFVTLNGGLSGPVNYGAVDQPQVLPLAATSPGGALDLAVLPMSFHFGPTDIADRQVVELHGGGVSYYTTSTVTLAYAGGSRIDWLPGDGTLAWQLSNGQWAVLYGRGPDASRSSLVDRQASLHIAATPGPLPTLPYSARWLPDGLVVSSLSWVEGPSGNYVSTVSLRGPSGASITIDVSHDSSVATGSALDAHGSGMTVALVTPSPASAPVSASTTVDDTHITIAAIGFSQTDVERILAGLDLTRLTTPAQWFAPAAAFSN